MRTTTRYGFGTEIAAPFEEAVARVKEACEAEGFGTLTEIDVKAKLKEKIDRDIEPYTILGMCNPQLASRALDSEHEIGLLLPCNVLVHACGGRVRVSVQDPMVMMDVAGNPDLRSIAEDARDRLERALSTLGG